jgi:hypothetical protein
MMNQSAIMVNFHGFQFARGIKNEARCARSAQIIVTLRPTILSLILSKKNGTMTTVHHKGTKRLQYHVVVSLRTRWAYSQSNIPDKKRIESNRV